MNKINLMLPIVLIASAFTTLNATQLEKKEALVVGVSDYAGTNSDLNGIDRDVEKMKNLFQTWGFHVTLLYNKESMKIVDYLDKYGDNLTAKDTFAFYYSGHGSHKKDTSHDEADGQDETLVLSDGVVNKHLIDDILYAKFNNIKAKKIVFFDSCHSGTVFRSLGSKTQAKTIKPEDVLESFQMTSTRGISMGGKKESIEKGDFVVFSSSRDTEESLATPTGSLFTNSISEVFSDGSLKDKSLQEVSKVVEQKVLNYAKETDGIPHHPTISYSSSSIGNGSLSRFIQTKSIPTNSVSSSNSLENTFEQLISSGKVEKLSLEHKKTVYNTGDSVKFEIDTQQNRGYLTVFYIDKSDVTVLYPNPYVRGSKLNGKYKFPQDLANGQFELEAYKSCTGCQEEETTIYALFSSEPISNLSNLQSKGLKSFASDSSESKVMSRAVRIKATAKSTSSFIPKLAKYRFIVK